jgi:hypothetical protein
LPYEVAVDHETRTIAVVGFGTGTTTDTLRLIDDQRETFRAFPGYDFLYDSSRLRIDSGTADMLRVADALFTQARATFRKMAIVIPPERAPLARIFTALAHPYGVHANVFIDAGDARRWLAEDERAQPRSREA